jgi:hypothetical protein
MNDFLLWLGRIAGVVGLVICGVAGVTRLSGAYFLGGYQVGTVLLAGVAALMSACYLLLLVHTRRP